MFQSAKKPYFTACATVVALVALGSAKASSNIGCNKNGSGPEINACALDARNMADRAIKRTVSKISKRMNGHDNIKFLAEHQAWLEIRSVECRALLSEDEGYTIWKSEYNHCIADLTNAKNLQLIKRFTYSP